MSIPPRMRLTKPTVAVLDVLAGSTRDDPVWGLRIVQEADLGPGSVYPILERLASAGWIDTWDEEERPRGRPPRRYYMLNNTGREQWHELAQARAASRRRRGWTRARPVHSGEA
jgi:PadR family transcriptional regulator, regulatory protein PadR